MTSSADPVAAGRGRTLVVAQDGSGDYVQIQPAVDAARPGDTVMIRSGTYTEDVSLRSGVILRGKSSDTTEVVAATERALIANSVEDTSVFDLGFRGGPAGRHVVRLRNSRVTFCRCHITGATNFGISLESGGHLTLSQSAVTGNQMDGLYLAGGGEALVERCTFAQNRGNGIVLYGTATLTGNTIVGNSEAGVRAQATGRVRLERNVIVSNGDFGVIVQASEARLLRNCLWQNQPADCRGNLPSRNDLNADPRFVDPENGDYHLREDSPCIGAGPNGEDLGAFPFERPLPAPVTFPTTALLHQLRTLPLSHHPGTDAAPRRVARWLRCAAAARLPLPLFLARDLGLLLGGAAAGPEERTITRPPHLPHDLDTADYLAFLGRIAGSPLSRELAAWDPPLSDPVLAAILARLIDDADLPTDYRLPGGAAGVVFLRLLGERLAEADPVEIWRDTPLDERPDPQAFFQPAILAQIESNLRRLDPEELRFLSRYGPPLLGAPDPRELLDLLHLTALPRAARLALSQTLKLLPRISAARTVGGVQTYPEGGYEGLARRGSLDSLLPSELAYAPPLRLHRVANREALYYGRERPRERRRELAYLVAQSGYGLGGDGQVLSKALVLALAQAMRRRGYEVQMSFAGRELGEPRPLESPSDVARVLYHQEKTRADETAALSGVLRQLRAWREGYRGREVLWVLGEHFDADGAGEHRELYRSLRAEAGQQAWFVRVGRRDRAKPPAAARWFERWQVVGTELLWESEEPPEPAILPPVEEPPPEAGDLWRDPVLGIEFSCIPPGTFLMGSPGDEEGYSDETRHRVTLTEGFRMARVPVTQGQFARFVEDTGYETDAEREGKSRQRSGDGWEEREGVTWRDSGGERHPVAHVSWNDARAFCRWLSERLGETVRLPTEAEWEYAARAGKGGARYGTDVGEIGWYRDNSDGRSHPVGGKQPNAWGLYDTLGNLWEWVEDAADQGKWQTVSGLSKELVVTPETYRNDAVNPRSSSGEYKVLRGGGWYDPAVILRATQRAGFPAGSRYDDLGFRLATVPAST